MAKAAFAGEESLKKHVPAGCQMSFYTEKNTGAVADLAKTHAATDSWYGGSTHYDYALGTYKASAVGDAKKLAEAFTRMVWAST
jgi:hypothetical protein